MHLSVKNQLSTDPPAVMCVERDIQTVIILNAPDDKVEMFYQIAAAMKALPVYILAKPGQVGELIDRGWRADPLEYTLMVKGDGR